MNSQTKSNTTETSLKPSGIYAVAWLLTSYGRRLGFYVAVASQSATASRKPATSSPRTSTSTSAPMAGL